MGVADRLHLNFRVEDGAGQGVVGSYGLPMTGRYQDRNREYAPFVGEREMGNELLGLEPLERGDYRLLVSVVHVPAELAGAAPRIVLEPHASAYAALAVAPLLGLSGLLAVAGVVMLVVGSLGGEPRVRESGPTYDV